MSNPLNFFPVDRVWFLTWTTYGTWLPGDDRGYVGEARDRTGQMVMHNELNSPPLPPNSKLRRSAENSLKYEICQLNITQAEALFEQFQETATHRRWVLNAIGIMQTHLHIVIGVPGDPDANKVLGDLKAYGSRRLNRLASQEQPTLKAWWITGGSSRKVKDETSAVAVIDYIRHQPYPLLIWTREDGILFSARVDDSPSI